MIKGFGALLDNEFLLPDTKKNEIYAEIALLFAERYINPAKIEYQSIYNDFNDLMSIMDRRNLSDLRTYKSGN
jgi:hypothetical protein